MPTTRETGANSTNDVFCDAVPQAGARFNEPPRQPCIDQILEVKGELR